MLLCASATEPVQTTTISGRERWWRARHLRLNGQKSPIADSPQLGYGPTT